MKKQRCQELRGKEPPKHWHYFICPWWATNSLFHLTTGMYEELSKLMHDSYQIGIFMTAMYPSDLIVQLQNVISSSISSSLHLSNHHYLKIVFIYTSYIIMEARFLYGFKPSVQPSHRGNPTGFFVAHQEVKWWRAQVKRWAFGLKDYVVLLVAYTRWKWVKTHRYNIDANTSLAQIVMGLCTRAMREKKKKKK